MVSDTCYWIIPETGKLVSKTPVEHVTRDNYLKQDIDSRVDDFNKKLTERLDDGNFQINSDVDSKFDFILPDKDISKNIGVNYARIVTPTDKEYDEMIVEGRPNEKYEVIYKYLNMNFIFDVGTKDKR